jgi:uncharacterized protein
MLFADASAIVKRYIRERHSVSVRRRLASGPVAVSRLSEVEVPSALARLARQGQLSSRRHRLAVTAFVTDIAAWHIVELTSEITALARTQLTRYDLRTGDAVQLASALWLRKALPETTIDLMAYDTRLVTAAKAEGLVVNRAGSSAPSRLRE